MVFFVRHRQVDDGQHHEDERLQGDDQDVEYSPRPLQNNAQAAEPEQAAAEHHSDQNEHQLATGQYSRRSLLRQTHAYFYSYAMLLVRSLDDHPVRLCERVQPAGGGPGNAWQFPGLTRQVLCSTPCQFVAVCRH